MKTQEKTEFPPEGTPGLHVVTIHITTEANNAAQRCQIYIKRF